jgi:GNAT superfamily N-acetyltransferase
MHSTTLLPPRPPDLLLQPAGIAIRPLRRGDVATVQVVFDGLSPRSRLLRFHAPVPRLSARSRQVLADADGCRHVALVAVALSEPVGIARFVRTGPGVAELAVEVVDTWQGHGIGRALLEELRTHAAALGYRELHAEVLLGNEPVIALLRRLFPGAVLHADDPHTGTLVCPVQPRRAEVAA